MSAIYRVNRLYQSLGLAQRSLREAQDGYNAAVEYEASCECYSVDTRIEARYALLDWTEYLIYEQSNYSSIQRQYESACAAAQAEQTLRLYYFAEIASDITSYSHNYNNVLYSTDYCY